MSLSVYQPYFLAGCVFWPLSFHLIWYSLSRWVGLADKQACGTAMRLVSIIHAVMAAIVGTISVMNTQGDIIYDDHWLLNYFAAFAYPYMPYDTYAMYQVYVRESKKRFEYPVSTSIWMFLTSKNLEVFHHFISTFLGYPIILHYRGNKGTFIVGCVYITEYSTPFVNLRKILITNGYGSTIWFTLNNLIVLVAFFLVRVALWPIMYLMFSINKQLGVADVIRAVPYGCHIAMAIVMALQTSWFVLFFRGFVKLLREPRNFESKREIDANGHAVSEKKDK